MYLISYDPSDKNFFVGASFDEFKQLLKNCRFKKRKFLKNAYKLKYFIYSETPLPFWESMEWVFALESN